MNIPMNLVLIVGGICILEFILISILSLFLAKDKERVIKGIIGFSLVIFPALAIMVIITYYIF